MVRRSSRKTFIGIISAVMSVLCIVLYTHTLSNQAEKQRSELLAQYGGEQVEVCVAARDIAPGEIVDASALTTKLWLSDSLPEQAIQDSSAVIGRQVTSSVLKGEVLSEHRFVQGEINFDVPAGLVALSVSADVSHAIGGAVAPGMLVDVYSSGQTTTACLGKSLLVLATSTSQGQEGLLSSGVLSWITIAVPQESVQEFIQAEQKTSLYFTLSQTDDVQDVAKQGEANEN